MKSSSSVKERQLKAFRYIRKKVIEKAGKAVWQHHALYICRDGVELLPHKWYHTDKTFTEVHGPFDDQVAACLACNAYNDAFLEA